MVGDADHEPDLMAVTILTVHIDAYKGSQNMASGQYCFAVESQDLRMTFLVSLDVIILAKMVDDCLLYAIQHTVAVETNQVRAPIVVSKVQFSLLSLPSLL